MLNRGKGTYILYSSGNTMITRLEIVLVVIFTGILYMKDSDDK